MDPVDANKSYREKGLEEAEPTPGNGRLEEHDQANLSPRQRFVRSLLKPGSAIQIVIAAVLGLAIGLVSWLRRA